MAKSKRARLNTTRLNTTRLITARDFLLTGVALAIGRTIERKANELEAGNV